SVVPACVWIPPSAFSLRSSNPQGFRRHREESAPPRAEESAAIRNSSPASQRNSLRAPMLGRSRQDIGSFQFEPYLPPTSLKHPTCRVESLASADLFSRLVLM